MYGLKASLCGRTSGQAAGDVVYGENVKAEGNVFHVAFGEEALGGASNDKLFLRGHAKLWQSGQLHVNCSGAHFYERKNLSVATDKIDFILRSAARGVVARDKDIAQLPQIPIRERFSTDSGSPFARAVCGIHLYFRRADRGATSSEPIGTRMRRKPARLITPKLILRTIKQKSRACQFFFGGRGISPWSL